MAFVTALILAFTVFDGPVRWLVIVAGILVEVVEAILLIRLSRHRRPAVGVETLIGRRARVVVACDPLGQVQIDGELWTARCEDHAQVGAPVTITGRDGLTLDVRC